METLYNISMYKLYISNSFCEKLLGVKIDSQLEFNSHLEGTCFA